jgi:hypothetical protein
MQRRDLFLLVVLLILVIVVAHVLACERADTAGFTTIVGGSSSTQLGVFTHRLLPAGQLPHSHLAMLNHGDGSSTINLGHSHRVHNYKADSAGTDAHSHDIIKYVVNTG